MVSAGTLLRTQTLYKVVIYLRTKYKSCIPIIPSIIDIKTVLMNKITGVWVFWDTVYLVDTCLSGLSLSTLLERQLVIAGAEWRTVGLMIQLADISSPQATTLLPHTRLATVHFPLPLSLRTDRSGLANSWLVICLPWTGWVVSRRPLVTRISYYVSRTPYHDTKWTTAPINLHW